MDRRTFPSFQFRDPEFRRSGNLKCLIPCFRVFRSSNFEILNFEDLNFEILIFRSSSSEIF